MPANDQVLLDPVWVSLTCEKRWTLGGSDYVETEKNVVIVQILIFQPAMFLMSENSSGLIFRSEKKKKRLE